MVQDFANSRAGLPRAYRNTHVLKAFVFFAFDHMARKGYDKAIATRSVNSARLWMIAFGCRKVEGKGRRSNFDGHPEPYIDSSGGYPSGERSLGTHNQRFRFRTEGFWDAPSEYEAVA